MKRKPKTKDNSFEMDEHPSFEVDGHPNKAHSFCTSLEHPYNIKKKSFYLLSYFLLPNYISNHSHV